MHPPEWRGFQIPSLSASCSNPRELPASPWKSGFFTGLITKIYKAPPPSCRKTQENKTFYDCDCFAVPHCEARRGSCPCAGVRSLRRNGTC